ncbi:MAG: LTA synthase family protein [Chitinophagaceae bacterium]|nr:LTA synthase family protein [Chitinophagaceae bacterium]
MLYFYIHDDSFERFNVISFKSLLLGLQFDTVVLCYVLLLPMLLLTLQSAYNFKKPILFYFVSAYLSLISAMLLLISIADIPYFKFFHTRLSEASLQWMNSWRTVLQMIFENKLYLSLLLFALVALPALCVLVWRSCMRYFSQHFNTNSSSRSRTGLFALLLALLCFCGLRGKIAHPIRMGDASYCHSALLNQIGLNPAFCLLKSYTEKVKLMNEDEALRLTREYLNLQTAIDSISPIARYNEAAGTPLHVNIVLVLMESMSAHYMAYFGNQDGLTPNLDILAGQSMFFRNAYSAGIHTNNGIFSSLYSFPALKRIRPMNTMPIRKYSGLPAVTKHYGYQNLFFCAHSFEFDNIVNFMPENNFDKIISSDMFPPEASISGFGVPDNYLFTEAIRFFDSTSGSGPFFATILTASNHEPYALPKDYVPKYKDKNLNSTAYADWSIGQFLQKAKTKTWFDSTIFIFVADHGFRVGENAYELELSYQHIPILFYAPKMIQPEIRDELIGQIDLFPTLMGMLNMRYINNTLGENILKRPRPCIYFSADDKIGCIDQKWLYVHKFSGGESLYDYRSNNTHNFAAENKSDLERLRKYAFSQIQTSEWMYSNDKTNITGGN